MRVTFKNSDARKMFVKAKSSHGKLHAWAIVRYHGRTDQTIPIRNELSALKVDLLHELKNVLQKLSLAYVRLSVEVENSLRERFLSEFSTFKIRFQNI